MDDSGEPVVCSAAAKQAVWGRICEDGYTLDGEVCDEANSSELSS